MATATKIRTPSHAATERYRIAVANGCTRTTKLLIGFGCELRTAQRASAGGLQYSSDSLSRLADALFRAGQRNPEKSFAPGSERFSRENRYSLLQEESPSEGLGSFSLWKWHPHIHGRTGHLHVEAYLAKRFHGCIPAAAENFDVLRNPTRMRTQRRHGRVLQKEREPRIAE
jgi:hypothetical protein